MTKEEKEALSRILEERIDNSESAFNESKQVYNLGRFEEAVFIRHLLSKLLK